MDPAQAVVGLDRLKNQNRGCEIPNFPVNCSHPAQPGNDGFGTPVYDVRLHLWGGGDHGTGTFIPHGPCARPGKCHYSIFGAFPMELFGL